ncbi:MAG: hypothetical protein AAF086_07200 [Planctomycetota bacterium]
MKISVNYVGGRLYEVGGAEFIAKASQSEYSYRDKTLQIHFIEGYSGSSELGFGSGYSSATLKFDDESQVIEFARLLLSTVTSKETSRDTYGEIKIGEEHPKTTLKGDAINILQSALDDKQNVIRDRDRERLTRLLNDLQRGYR